MNVAESAIIVALTEDIQPVEYVLRAESCTIGRSSTCNVIISNRDDVSRLHVTIEPDGPRFVLIDKSSANGTFINGIRKNEPHLLTNQDAIGLGSPLPILRFEDMDPTAVKKHRIMYNNSMFFLDNQPLNLTPNQLRLMQYLHQNSGQACKRDALYEAMRQEDYDHDRDTNALDRAIYKLRSKLNKVNPGAGAIIKLRRGIGYELDI